MFSNHQLSAGLLQLIALRNCRQSVKATTVHPECSYMINHWYATYRAHQTSFAVARLTTSQATDFVVLVLVSWRYWSTSALTGVHQPTWLMTAAWSATAGPVLDRRRTWRNWTFHWPKRRLVTDHLLSMDHASGTVYRRQFATRHCHWHL